MAKSSGDYVEQFLAAPVGRRSMMYAACSWSARPRPAGPPAHLGDAGRLMRHSSWIHRRCHHPRPPVAVAVPITIAEADQEAEEDPEALTYRPEDACRLIVAMPHG
jgi:hypothetical protein